MEIQEEETEEKKGKKTLENSNEEEEEEEEDDGEKEEESEEFDLNANLVHLGIWGSSFPLGIYSIALFLVFMCPAQYMTGRWQREWNLLLLIIITITELLRLKHDLLCFISR